MQNIISPHMTRTGKSTVRLSAIAGVIMSLSTSLLAAAPEAAPGPATAAVDRSALIFTMDAAQHRPGTFGKAKTSVGTIEVVPGKVGNACRFAFVEGASGGFFTGAVQADEAWDRAAGFSFWLKGDGSSNWGGLELIDRSDYRLRYGYCFPLDSTEWRKITVPWCDLIPELPAGLPVGPEDGYAPSRFGNLWFGKWYYWRDYPAHSFTVDEIRLESAIEIDRANYTPDAPGLPRLQASLEAGKPVTIVTMGDSLSDKRHWANRETLWSNLLARGIEDRYASKVSVVNPAIGGTQLTQNLVLMPRWLRDTPEPDLVTMWFGYNDWDGGMRGDHFRRMLGLAVDRIRRMTHGKSEVLLITTCPSVARWDTMEELVEAVRAAAMEKRTGLADVSAAFHKAGANEASRPLLFCSDKTHLGQKGHELAAATILAAITATGTRGPTTPGE